MVPRFGEDGYRCLPRHCWLSMPARTPEWTRYPATHYEGLVAELMSGGVPVAGHPAACTVPGCHHAIVWHAHKTRDHACEVKDCACRKLARATAVPASAP